MIDNFLKEHQLELDSAVMTKLIGIFHASSRDDLYYIIGSREGVIEPYMADLLKKGARKGLCDRTFHIKQNITFRTFIG